MTGKSHTTNDVKVFTGSKRRLFLQRYAPGPDEPYYYWGRFKVGDVEQARGEPDRIEAPADDEFDEWTSVGEVTKALEKGSLDFNGLADSELTEDIWDILYDNELATVQILIGASKHPQDIDGWEGKLVLFHTRCNNAKQPDGGAQTGGDNNAARISGTFQYWMLLPG